MTRAALACAAALAVVGGGAGCASPQGVERAYGGAVLVGRYVGAEAYAAFLRGAMAEAAGQPGEALRAYDEAAKRDPSSPEIWVRIGEVRCQQDPHDGAADAAFSRARDVDARYARAWAAASRCALTRGDAEGARAAAERAAILDPSADGANVLLARSSTSAAPAGAADSRQRLVALTLTAHEPLVAWTALATWCEAQGDVALWSRALRETARLAPSRRDAVARAAEELAGLGQLAEARAVAAAAVDADGQPLPSTRPLAARLAVDEAIARGDEDTTRRRATRVRLALDEVAGRALLAGNAPLARTLASEAARGDPTARGARWVLAAAARDARFAAAPLGRGNDAGIDGAAARPDDAPVSPAALVAFGATLVRDAPLDEVRATLASVPHGPFLAGDDRVVRTAVELASRGVLAVSMLPPDGMVELAVIRGDAPAEPAPPLDPRHRYLALAVLHPNDAATRDLGARLAPARGSDPVVAAAASLAGLGAGAPSLDPAAPRVLLARDPTDPLLAATALRLAEKLGDHDVARRARAALTVLGRRERSIE